MMTKIVQLRSHLRPLLRSQLRSRPLLLRQRREFLLSSPTDKTIVSSMVSLDKMPQEVAVAAEAVAVVVEVRKASVEAVVAQKVPVEAVVVVVVKDAPDPKVLRVRSARDAPDQRVLKVKSALTVPDLRVLKVKSALTVPDLRVLRVKLAFSVRDAQDQRVLKVKSVLTVPDLRVLKVRSVNSVQEPKVAKAAEEADVHPEPRELREKKALSSRERRELVLTPRITISRETDLRNGTHSTERTALEEAEVVPPREELARATGEQLPMSSSKEPQLNSRKVKSQPSVRRPRLMRPQLRRLQLRNTSQQLLRKKKMRARANLPFKSTSLPRSTQLRKRKLEHTKRSRRTLSSKQLLPRPRRLPKSTTFSRIRKFTTLLLVRLSSPTSSHSRDRRTTSTSRELIETDAVAEVASVEVAVAKKAAVVVVVAVVASPRVLPEEEDNSNLEWMRPHSPLWLEPSFY